MLVGVCDFPSRYSFPPVGYGGIERWLWATATGAREEGADVRLPGPQWRVGPVDGWTVEPARLEDLHPGSSQLARLRGMGYDLLIVGHEYPSLPAWRRAWEELGCDVASFQHAPDFRHAPGAFDGDRVRLYCYSAEMTERYSACSPRAEVAVHLGLGEETAPRDGAGDGLIWLGRIDEEKAPHIAVLAARIVGRRIRIVGPVFDAAYVERHSALFRTRHVELAGELGGTRKAEALRAARVLVYTCARQYVEAGAAVFGESLRAGTPVAALAWRGGTCANAALCVGSESIALLPQHASDDEAAAALAESIERAAELRPADVQEIGTARFSPAGHFRALAARL